VVKKDYTRRISELHKHLSTILEKDAIPIGEVLKNKPHQFDVQGVYVITTPDDKTIIWVGETRTKKVIGRIQNHCKLNQSSDLNVILKKDLNYPQDYNTYLVRCLEETDDRKRGQLEHFLLGVLQPIFNK
jgi:ribosomal protein S3